ncbi:MAG: SpaA isopeptide-forming pilin-related protein [Oscillospiraceae bacterium]|nr:SpaA isopeptide-forming pilin-related protein [Oscillospiraceae bacterium]
MRKRFSALLAAALMLLNITAFAHNVPDLTKVGSIHVTMRCDGRAVSGGTLTLYRPGDVYEEDGNFSFRLSEDFSGYEDGTLEVLSPELAAALRQYARDKGLKGITQRIGKDGVAFQDLTPGLYLLVQEQAPSGYYKADPFLVTIPLTEDGVYVYDVDASPKVEVDDKPDRPDKPSQPSEPDQPGGPDQPSEPDTPPPGQPDEPSVTPPDTPDTPQEPGKPTLPQTGQLNWPVPVLAAAGLGLFAAGWALCFRRKDHET